jgi:hypothetical protein
LETNLKFIFDILDMAEFKLGDTVYRTRFYIPPGSGISKKNITARHTIHDGPVEYIEGRRDTKLVFELHLNPGLPREKTHFSYSGQTGYFTLYFDGQEILKYAFPKGNAQVNEKFKIL